MAPFVDSHVHLADAAFDPDRADVIERARLGGARMLVCIGESIAAAERARAIAAAYPGFVHFTAGIHPHDAHAFEVDRDIPALRAMIRAGAVAIGECGLDYHYDHSPRSTQLDAFEAQMELAADAARPLVVHTRQAVEDTRALIERAGKIGVRGVLHCFTGPRELAVAALDAGWHLSFSGVITFRKWSEDALLRLASVDKLLVESDAPYLAPVPHRGKRNEPAFVSFTLAKLAEARGLTPAALGEIVVQNTRDFFDVSRSPV